MFENLEIYVEALGKSQDALMGILNNHEYLVTKYDPESSGVNPSLASFMQTPDPKEDA